MPVKVVTVSQATLLAGLSVLCLPVSSIKSSYNLCDVKPGFSPNGDFFPTIGDHAYITVNMTGNSKDSSYHCLMRFTTCKNCHFLVSPVSTFRFSPCFWNDMYNFYRGRCAPGCTYLHMFDPDYRNETSKSYTRGLHNYVSQSSKIYILICSNKSLVKNIQIKIELKVLENKEEITGSAHDSPSTGVIGSPFFPMFYTENDETYTFDFNARNHNEVVQLVFDDWNLARRSSIWFQHANIEGPVYGSSPRPYIISDGQKLNMQFKTGIATSTSVRNYLGFKATYRFYIDRTAIEKRITGCGQYMLNSDGGTISFTPTANANDYYDCIWVVKKQREYDRIFIKLIKYKGSQDYFSGHNNQLTIRSGLASPGNIKISVTPDSSDSEKFFSFEDDIGFSIRLKGRYTHLKDLVLAYTSFRYIKCVVGEFVCQNNRCIPSHLKCDGADHCGDKSDELNELCGDKQYSLDRRYSYTISIGVIIPMVVSIFLIVVICLLIIFIRRCRRLNNQTRTAMRDPANNVSANVSRRNRRRSRSRIQMNLTIQQDSPPTYDEVIRNTPIGYLNMAFMWSQPEMSMTSPPTYEDATSPVTDLPRLTSPDAALNASNSSSSSVESMDPRPRILPPSSDSSSDGSHISHTRVGSYSSDSTVPDHEERPLPRHYSSVIETSPLLSRPYQSQLTRNRLRKLVEDEFIESPVSSSTLGNKEVDVTTKQTPKQPPETDVQETGAVGSPVSSCGTPSLDGGTGTNPVSTECSRNMQPNNGHTRRSRGQGECPAPRPRERRAGRPGARRSTSQGEDDQQRPSTQGYASTSGQEASSNRREELILKAPRHPRGYNSSPTASQVEQAETQINSGTSADGHSTDGGVYLSLCLNTDAAETDVFV